MALDEAGAQLRPGTLALLATRLDEAIEQFRRWGIRVPEKGRLPDSSLLLKEVAARNGFPPSEEQLSVLAEAIRHAQEFIEIADVLPQEPIHSVLQDLRTATGGELRPVDGSTGPHLQHQTQLWIGAMLAQAGAQVKVLEKPGSAINPDFLIDNGTLRYAIEVKRPNGELDAQNIVRKAARQIRSDRFHGGMIVVDFTDCVDPAIRHRCGRGEPDFGPIQDAVSLLLKALHDRVFDDASEKLRSRREHVFGLIGFVRAAYWDLDTLEHPYLIRHVGTVRYWRRDHRTLRAIRAEWLGELIHHGIAAAGHQQSERIPMDWSGPRPG